MTARIIEPTSKQDAARVLAEAEVRALSNRTMKRRPRGMPSRSGGTGCRGRARPAARSDPPPWCSVTSRPCGSRVRHEAHGSYSPRSGDQREGRLVGLMANRVRETGPGTIAGQETVGRV